MVRWTLKDAKSRLSELVRRARRNGPQVITLRGRDAVVVVSAKEYARLGRPRESLADFVRRSPMACAGLEVGRRETGSIYWRQP